MPLQGWYRDPYGRHYWRWFDQGHPTNLVHDDGPGSYYEPPQNVSPADPRGRPEKWFDRLPLWQYVMLYFWIGILPATTVVTVVLLTHHQLVLGIGWWAEYGVSYAILSTLVAMWARAVRKRRRRRVGLPGLG